MMIWEETLVAIAPRLNDHVYKTYFEPMRCVDERADGLTVALPNKFIRDWVMDHYHDFLLQQVRLVAGRDVDLEVIVDDAARTLPPTLIPPPPAPPAPVGLRPALAGAESRPGLRRLNEKYSFDTFVCGASNQFAYAACKAVAERPGTNYNPLFIFGGVGLGKTHIINSIGLEIQRQHPDWHILVLSAETFTNEVIASIRVNQMDALRRKYRDECDVLLMDDIQFLAGKDRTQEEFFHTFNTLYETKRQIVITSDKSPNEIRDLEDRLSSRFQWGLIADIQPPELETRVAIVEKKAQLDGIYLPNDVAMFLATHIKSNVRELEGSLIRLEAFASLTGQEITIELAKEVLRDVVALRGQKPDVEHIQKSVASFFNIKIQDMRSQRRHKQVSLPRQVAMYLTRKLTGMSFPEIGNAFGGKDHSTVMSAVRKIDRLVKEDVSLRQAVETLERSLSN